ncbi:UNVERIFIED_CONTAM: hypothetical protein Slati_4040100 [Sesamum latifolium]|uniref:Endonuclease/exonuclease/phosphatase domain-containing protein n=1 Tax=Sesamum latifolium TaxID=2727402 RepID=A0AAW2TRR8_9LAMI
MEASSENAAGPTESLESVQGHDHASEHQGYIDVSAQLEDNQSWWRFTGIYGAPDISQRVDTWRLLTRLHAQSTRDWLCAGDFNEILDRSEKSGGPPRLNWQMRNFRTALTECGLSDIGFTGSPFTWINRHASPYTVYERLDRACANRGGRSCFQMLRSHISQSIALIILLSLFV